MNRSPLYLAALLLVACSSSPPRPIDERYARQSWAAVSVEQAQAECQAEINRIGGIPSMFLCMRAKGWEER